MECFRKGVILSAVFVILSMSCSAYAYTWCHDYTLYQLTKGKLDLNKTSVSELRRRLENMGLKKHSYPAGSDWGIVDRWLVPFDVIIIGNAHSGFVWGRTLYHYTQDGKVHRDSLSGLMNFHRNINGYIQYPYRNMPVELWRWVRK